MPDLTDVITWEVQLFLLAMLVIVATGLLTGQINTKGLLRKKEGDRSFSPERVVVLLASMATAFQYLSQVVKDSSHLPDVAQNWLLLLGGSHALYLARKTYLRRSPTKKS